MSDEMDKCFKQAMEFLSKPENLNGLLNLFGRTNNDLEFSNPQSEVPSSKETSRVSSSSLGSNIELFSRIQNIMSALNSRKDPRIDLLTAISPFINGKKQKKVNNCVQLLRLSQLLPLLPLLLNSENSKSQ